MNEKPLRLNMGFDEALSRLIKAPRESTAITKSATGKAGKPKGRPAKINAPLDKDAKSS